MLYKKMVGQAEKKDAESLLAEIYDNKKIEQKVSFKQTIRNFLSHPAKVDRLLAGAVLFFGLAAIVLGFFQFKFRVASYFFPKGIPGISLDSSGLSGAEADLLGLRQ